MKKRLAIVLTIIMSAAIFSSCGNSVTDENEELQKSIKDANIRIANLEKRVKDNEEALEEVTGSKNKDSQTKTSMAKLKIYTVDVNSYKTVDTGEVIEINEENSVEDNVGTVIENIIKKAFKSSKHDLSFVKENNKNIAVLNLIDEKENKFWYNSFQGSTGGLIHSKELIENILQKDYNGKWIDGLKVLYNGEKAQFQHAPELEKVIYRQ